MMWYIQVEFLIIQQPTRSACGHVYTPNMWNWLSFGNLSDLNNNSLVAVPYELHQVPISYKNHPLTYMECNLIPALISNCIYL